MDAALVSHWVKPTPATLASHTSVGSCSGNFTLLQLSANVSRKDVEGGPSP